MDDDPLGLPSAASSVDASLPFLAVPPAPSTTPLPAPQTHSASTTPSKPHRSATPRTHSPPPERILHTSSSAHATPEKPPHPARTPSRSASTSKDLHSSREHHGGNHHASSSLQEQQPGDTSQPMVAPLPVRQTPPPLTIDSLTPLELLRPEDIKDLTKEQIKCYLTTNNIVPGSGKPEMKKQLKDLILETNGPSSVIATSKSPAGQTSLSSSMETVSHTMPTSTPPAPSSGDGTSEPKMDAIMAAAMQDTGDLKKDLDAEMANPPIADPLAKVQKHALTGQAVSEKCADCHKKANKDCTGKRCRGCCLLAMKKEGYVCVMHIKDGDRRPVRSADISAQLPGYLRGRDAGSIMVGTCFQPLQTGVVFGLSQHPWFTSVPAFAPPSQIHKNLMTQCPNCREQVCQLGAQPWIHLSECDKSREWFQHTKAFSLSAFTKRRTDGLSEGSQTQGSVDIAEVSASRRYRRHMDLWKEVLDEESIMSAWHRAITTCSDSTESCVTSTVASASSSVLPSRSPTPNPPPRKRKAGEMSESTGEDTQDLPDETPSVDGESVLFDSRSQTPFDMSRSSKRPVTLVRLASTMTAIADRIPDAGKPALYNTDSRERRRQTFEANINSLSSCSSAEELDALRSRLCNEGVMSDQQRRLQATPATGVIKPSGTDQPPLLPL